MLKNLGKLGVLVGVDVGMCRSASCAGTAHCV